MTAGPESSDRPEDFATTHWSLVLSAGREADPAAAEALAALCQAYWTPLYAFLRRSGHHEHDARDLTQAFFATLLAKNYVGDADPARGRFRAFLLASIGHFVSNQRKADRAQKRGGGRPVVSLSVEQGEASYLREPADHLTPERLFERQWARALLDRVLEQLADEFARAGRTAEFACYRQLLVPAGDAARQQDVARQLGQTEGAVKMALHRLRKRYRQLVRAEIARTVADPADVEDELAHLWTVLRGE